MMPYRGTHTLDRADDERDLQMLALRCEGLPASAIAPRFGMARGSVLRITNDIRHADATQSGEPLDAVAAGYW